jgi:probable HAF family extracellular repeat protein
MNNKFSKFKYITIILTGISAVSIPATASAGWSIREISFKDFNNNHVDAAAFDINNVGQVTGIYQGFPGQKAFIVGPDGSVGETTLGTIGGKSSVAFGINDSGQVVGSSNESGHAFITGPDGVGTTDLGTLGGYYSGGYGINNSGQAAGYSYTSKSSSNYHAFITGPNGEGMTDLGTLTGGSEDSFAYGINDAGQVVGNSGNHAFITGPNGSGMIDLGAFGGINSIATAINNSGQAVGYTLSPFVHAFQYNYGEMIDLSKLEEVVAAGWTNLLTAEGINDYGQIVGAGILHGQNAAYVLSPFSIPPYPVTTVYSIPEPETYAMLLVGLGLIGFMARRRKESAV